MTYEVQFKIGDAEYTVRGPDTAGILALIDGLEPKAYVPPQRLREAYTQVNTSEPPLPEIEDPHAELRKTWAPGQHWQARTRGKTEWISIAGKLHWHADQEYRRAPEDGWITMIGSNRPVRAHAKVEVKYASGVSYGPVAAHTLDWNAVHAYRVVSPCA